MKRALPAAISIFLFTCVPRIITGCDCEPGRFDPKSWVDSSSAVFIGRVVEKKDLLNPDGWSTQTTFVATESWKGVKSAGVSIFADWSDCNLTFEKGKEYLVFASRGEGPKGELTAWQCSYISESPDPWGRQGRIEQELRRWRQSKRVKK